MKVKQKSVCQNCRTRKIGCDGKLPACSQCVISGHNCDGYRTDWKFISHIPMQSSISEQHDQGRIVRKGAGLQEDSPTGYIPPQLYLNPLIVCNFTELITKSFVPQDERIIQMCNSDYMEPQICGSWVKVLSSLPCLNSSSRVLPRAVTALAASLLSQPSKSNMTFSETYHAAIHTLRESFGMDRRSLSLEQIPAIMCLTLVELMISDSAAAIASHIQAVGLLLQAHGPGMCSFGLLRSLFLGFRPLLIMQACRSRQPTFLASQLWIDTPFSHFRPSLMHSLLNEVVILPALLHQSDCVLESLVQSDLSDINKIPRSFIDVLTRLDEWETTLQQRDQPCYWRCGYVSQEVESRTSDDTLFWYPNVTMANTFTNLWAFRIVCLSGLKRFISHFLDHDQEQPIWTGQLDMNYDDIQGQMIAFAKNISLSMAYLLQDEMKLFGPASTLFPLQMAYKVYKSPDSRQQVNIVHLEKIVDQLDQKGIKSARALVFDD